MSDTKDKSAYIEVKAYSNSIYRGKAEAIVNQGVKGLISGSNISKNAKEVLDKHGIWYRESVEPKDLEKEKEKEKGV